VRAWGLRAGLDQAGHTAVIKPQAPQATVEGGFTPDDAPGNCGRPR